MLTAAIETGTKQNSIYLKKIPSNKKLKEIYINKLKLINNDLKLSLQQRQRPKGSERADKKDEAKAEDVHKTEMAANLQPKRVVSEVVHESPMGLKQVRRKPSERVSQGQLKSSQNNLKTMSKNRNNYKIKKNELIKKKNMNLPLLRSKAKKTGKEPKKKERVPQKPRTSERGSNAGKSLGSRSSIKTETPAQATASKLNSDKLDSSKAIPKKAGNPRQPGKTSTKKSSSNGGQSSKKQAKQTGTSGNKAQLKGTLAEKKKPNDDEKPPNKPNPKLEKGHYLKDQAPHAKKKGDSGKAKAKRAPNAPNGKRKQSHGTAKNADDSDNVCSLTDILKKKGTEDDAGPFEPEKALKKKIAKKKNFSLNLDNFKKKVSKDYHTHVNKFVANIDKSKRPNAKLFRTEKASAKPEVEWDSDSEGGDFDYARGDSQAEDAKEGPSPQAKLNRSKNRQSKSKLSKSRNGLRVSGNLNSKLKGPGSRTSNDLAKRKRSKGRNLPKNNMSQNYKNHLVKEQAKKGAKDKPGIRNSSIKDFSRRKKQNLSISMNKRSGVHGGLRKSSEFLATRKKNQSINPGKRFMNLDKGERKKRAVSETRSVSEISFTNIERAGLRKVKNIVEYIKQREHILPPFTKARSVVKDFGIIRGFIVNTHKGCVRAGNEDRVSILLNAQHKFRKSQKKMSNCAMFSVFDGHGGTDCCNFLKENLHNKILADLDLHEDFDNSLKRIFAEVDQTYLKRAIKKKQNYSGSCANCLFVLDDQVVVVNTGDSRAICSKNGGREVEAMCIDHKPGCFSEFSRIIGNGGQLYRVSSNLKTIENMFYTVTNYSDVLQIDEIEASNKNLCFGPWRIKPGGLSVSRSFGDMESKIMKNGKHINLVIAEPEIFRFSHEELDFAVLASDGVYDKLSNQQIVETVWETIEYYKKKYKNMVEKKRSRQRNTSFNKNMKSSLNSNKSARLSSQVRRIKQGKSYSQVFDDQKRKRQDSRTRLRSNSKNLNSSQKRRPRSNIKSNTSIHLESGREIEQWEEEMRKKYDEILGECVNNILKRSLLNQSEDNVTLIMLVFKDLINPQA